MAGAALGYRLGGFRVEGEYFYRGTTYDSTDPDTIISDPETTRKVLQELNVIEGGVDDVLSNNFFVQPVLRLPFGLEVYPVRGVWSRVRASVAGLFRSICTKE